MRQKIIFLILNFFVLSFLVTKCENAKILGIFLAPVPSHFILDKALMTNLAKRGHDVTMVTFFEVQNPPKNLKQIVFNEDPTYVRKVQNLLTKMHGKSFIQILRDVMNISPEISEKMFNNSKVQELLNSKEKFDVMITEAPLVDPNLGFGHHFGCPIITLSTVGANPIVNNIFKNPSPTSYVQSGFSYKEKITFWDRVINFLAQNMMDLFMKLLVSKQNEILHEYFPTAPHIQELNKKIAILFLNSHVSVNPAKPHLPNMIEIGGFHIEEPEVLPKDLQTYMDTSKSGVILFSLGSNIQSADLDENKMDAILKAFSKLPYDIIWKFEAPNLPNKPSNVKIVKWLPQNDILAHPKLKLFITHGGLLSTTEAVYHGVPIVGIPIFGDQQMNMKLAILNGIGKELNFANLNEEDFLSTVKDVLDNPKYRQNAQKRSSLMKDQPMKPIDLAMYWVEYVIRHNGADHMKTSAMDLNWIELNQIDVIGFLVLVTGLVIVILLKISKFIFRKIFSSKANKVKRS